MSSEIREVVSGAVIKGDQIIAVIDLYSIKPSAKEDIFEKVAGVISQATVGRIDLRPSPENDKNYQKVGRKEKVIGKIDMSAKDKNREMKNREMKDKDSEGLPKIPRESLDEDPKKTAKELFDKLPEDLKKDPENLKRLENSLRDCVDKKKSDEKDSQKDLPEGKFSFAKFIDGQRAKGNESTGKSA